MIQNKMHNNDVTDEGQQDDQTSSYIEPKIWAALTFEQRKYIIQACRKKNRKNDKDRKMDDDENAKVCHLKLQAKKEGKQKNKKEKGGSQERAGTTLTSSSFSMRV